MSVIREHFFTVIVAVNEDGTTDWRVDDMAMPYNPERPVWVEEHEEWLSADPFIDDDMEFSKRLREVLP